MRDYELALVIDPEASGEDRIKQVTKVKKAIESLRGEVSKTDEWGRKELAYPIRKKNLGYYFLLTLKLPQDSPEDLRKKLKLEGKLLRYLLVQKEGNGEPRKKAE